MNHEFISNFYSLVFTSFLHLYIYFIHAEEMTPISEKVSEEDEVSEYLRKIQEPLYHFLEYDQVS